MIPDDIAVLVGRQVLNSILTGHALGHVTVRGQASYIHTNNPVSDLVMAFGHGRLDRAAEPLERLAGRPILELTRDHMTAAYRQAFGNALDEIFGIDTSPKETP